MVTTSHDPTNCGAEMAARQPTEIIGSTAESVKRECANPDCSETFESPNPRQEYCGHACVAAVSRRRIAAEIPPCPPIEYYCALCGEKFTAKCCTKRWCSHTCYLTAWKRFAPAGRAYVRRKRLQMRALRARRKAAAA